MAWWAVIAWIVVAVSVSCGADEGLSAEVEVARHASLQRMYCDGEWCLWLGSRHAVAGPTLWARNITAVLSVVDYTTYTGFERLRQSRGLGCAGADSDERALPFEVQRVGTTGSSGWLAACPAQTLDTVWLPAVDSPRFDFAAVLDSALAFVRQARAQRRSLLVHCMEGKSRSATVVIAFIMDATGATFEQVLDAVRQRRPVVDPNPTFRRLLVKRQRTAEQE